MSPQDWDDLKYFALLGYGALCTIWCTGQIVIFVADHLRWVP